MGCENAGTVADNITATQQHVLHNNEVAALAMGGYNYPSSGKMTRAVFRSNSTLKSDFLEEGYGEILPVILRRLCLENNIFTIATIADHAVVQLEQPGIIFDHNLFYHDGASSSQYFEWNGNVYAGLARIPIRLRHQLPLLFADPLYLLIRYCCRQPPYWKEVQPIIRTAGNDNRCTETDLDDQPRVLNDTIDCGAYEYYSEPVEKQICKHPHLSILIQFAHLSSRTHSMHILYISKGCMMSPGKIIGFWQPAPQQIPTDKLLPGYYLLVAGQWPSMAYVSCWWNRLLR